ncbi:MAG: iron-sulfur cluster assembly scaffold protein [Firmicutes bacterium]|nr:iron-sulfur cluster assembly scaffold protein [Bacillota bacterium]
MYSPAVLDHFQNPRNAGVLENATATVEVSNPVCGDVLRLAARVAEGCIADVRFQARGCVTAIACGSLLTELMRGRRLDDLGNITPETLSTVLGGLPPATAHGSQLAYDALQALLTALAR